MATITLDGIRGDARETVRPFLEDVLAKESAVHSIHIVGSVLTEDYVRGRSDINSAIFIHSMDLSFLDALAPLGKKYGKKKIAAPFVITPEYMTDSLDTFPIEFLNFKLLHQTVYGPDMFEGVEIDRKDLRLQCEREIKSKLMWLRHGYVTSLGDRKTLMESLIRSFAGYVPLFRAIIVLRGEVPPAGSHAVTLSLRSCCSLTNDIFEKIVHIKRGMYQPSKDEIPALFEQFYQASERLSGIINDLAV